MKKISIITTAHNAEKYIDETLESVLSQRGDFELEYIVIDAKSTDKTLEKITKYKSFVDNGFYEGRNRGIEIKVISEPDTGMYEGIAKGFKKVTGDIVAYINADDFYLPNALDCVCNIFNQFNQINWLTGRINLYNYRGHGIKSLFPSSYDKTLIKKGIYGPHTEFIQQESCFWRKELLDDLDINEFIKFKYAGDFYLWHTFAEKNELYVVNSNLSGFRQIANQKSTNLDAYYKEFNTIINKIELSNEEIDEISYINILNNINYKFKINNKQVIWDNSNFIWKLCEDNISKKNMVKLYLSDIITTLLKTKKGFNKLILEAFKELIKLNI